LNEIQNIISQLENQREAIERALGALREIAGTAAPAAKKRGRPPKKRRGGKRHMSAEGRARIAEATRKRWADKRAAEAAAEKKAATKRASAKKRIAVKKAATKTAAAAE
jgi:hypothetical protein